MATEACQSFEAVELSGDEAVVDADRQRLMVEFGGTDQPVGSCGGELCLSEQRLGEGAGELQVAAHLDGPIQDGRCFVRSARVRKGRAEPGKRTPRDPGGRPRSAESAECSSQRMARRRVTGERREQRRGVIEAGNEDVGLSASRTIGSRTSAARARSSPPGDDLGERRAGEAEPQVVAERLRDKQRLLGQLLRARRVTAGEGAVGLVGQQRREDPRVVRSACRRPRPPAPRLPHAGRAGAGSSPAGRGRRLARNVPAGHGSRVACSHSPQASSKST